MADKQSFLEKATVYLGQPIDPNLKTPLALQEIADLTIVDPGVQVKTFADRDDNSDDIYTVDVNGVISTHKVVASAATQLTFDHFNSKLEYLLVSEVMDAEDQQFLADKKASFTRSLDKLEVKNILTAILSLGTQEVLQSSAMDIYDLIKAQMNLIENYGDNYILLCGANVKHKIDTYDKDRATNFNYKVGMQEFLRDSGIKYMKVYGNLKVDGGAGTVAILDTDTMIMVARNSTIAQGKPVAFVRRRISPAIAEGMGVNPDEAERAVVITNTPTIIAGTNILGYGAYAYESIILAVLNKRAIAWTTGVV